jgi:hypothetical protein
MGLTIRVAGLPLLARMCPPFAEAQDLGAARQGADVE